MPAPARLLTLDALRGFAVMGILLMNAVAFAMPDLAYINPRLWGGETPAAFAVWTANFIAIDGKMRGLFSLLFGASTLLIYERAAARGDGPMLLCRRFFWLFLLGLIHYIFIWWGDILRLYAVAGFVLLFFVRREPVDLVKAAILFFLIQFVILAAMSGSMFIIEHAANLPGASPDDVSNYRDMLAGLGADPAVLEKQAALHRGGYWALVQDRIMRLESDQTTLLTLSGFEALGFMLLGMALLKGGFLTGARKQADYLRIARLSYLIGGLPMIALALWCWASGFDILVTFNAVISWSMPLRVPLAIGHAAILLWLILRFGNSSFIRRVANAGRAAFTNYIGTSIVMTTLFYGYGAGLYGNVGRVELYGFVLALWALMLLWSQPWLLRWRYGPFEWVWRSLTRWRLEPMRQA